ncbi:hypothetical protein [Burkholderia sp. SCN-KJ]|uniref:hypothetical protein n=1 Tax=Burkholderia sp. SCN-KJ TaxID=2969248 RepID=UPI00214F68B7|nr:hypothetical protein [Burkholderia sp. SCN-KJ]MCR4469741.1 hypothetical protein [Burkholderia sp. SCN-KJ]
MRLFKSTRKCKLAAAGTIALVLQGCGSVPPSTPQVSAENAKATLNVYPDNRVLMQVMYKATPTFWGWTSDKDVILALLIDGHAYNVRDIASLTSVAFWHSGQPAHRVTVQLKSGEAVSSVVANRGQNVAWLACNLQKACDSRQFLSVSDYHTRLNGMLTGVFETSLTAPPTRDTKLELVNDYRAVPSLVNGLQQIRFLNESEKATLDEKLARREQRWAEIQQANAQQEAANQAARRAREQAIEREGVEMRKHIRVGAMTNCGQVFELRRPMVGVQTMNGMQFIDISRLYGPSADCRFLNGQYVGR